jgi:hypothetical protein
MKTRNDSPDTRRWHLRQLIAVIGRILKVLHGSRSTGLDATVGFIVGADRKDAHLVSCFVDFEDGAPVIEFIERKRCRTRALEIAVFFGELERVVFRVLPRAQRVRLGRRLDRCGSVLGAWRREPISSGS